MAELLIVVVLSSALALWWVEAQTRRQHLLPDTTMDRFGAGAARSGWRVCRVVGRGLFLLIGGR